MIQLFHDVKIDWLGKRRIFIAISVTLMLAGMVSSVYRHIFHPRGTEAFNLGVDFKGGMLLTVRFKEGPSAEATPIAYLTDHSRDRKASVRLEPHDR